MYGNETENGTKPRAPHLRRPEHACPDMGDMCVVLALAIVYYTFIFFLKK